MAFAVVPVHMVITSAHGYYGLHIANRWISGVSKPIMAKLEQRLVHRSVEPVISVRF